MHEPGETCKDPAAALIPLPAHLDRLADALQFVDESCTFSDAHRLLRYAGGIRGIQYSAASVAAMLCSGAAEFERAEEQVLEPYLTRQARFTTCWMALEAVCNELDRSHAPAKLGRPGKINRLVKFLTRNTQLIQAPAMYHMTIDRWIEIENGLNERYKPRETDDRMEGPFDGIRRVADFRNHLVHGDFGGFLPYDESWAAYSDGLDVATRMVAFAMQMAFMAALKERKEIDLDWHSSLIEYGDQGPLSEALARLHLGWV